MKINLKLDNSPTLKSGDDIRTTLKRRHLTLMELCRRNHIMDIYHQFQFWLSGKPNQKHWRTFVRALRKEEIITEIEKETY